MTVSSLLFLGAGASKIFNLPDMKDLVPKFESKLKDTVEHELAEFEVETEDYPGPDERPLTIRNINLDDEDSLKFLPSGNEYWLFRKVKKFLEWTYPYVDLESIFSVLNTLVTVNSISDIPAEARFTYEFISSLGVQQPPFSTEKIVYDLRSFKECASRLLDEYKKFIELTFKIDDSQYDKIKVVFDSLFTHLGINLANPVFPPVYTTNYDLVFERYVDNYHQINEPYVDDGKGYRVFNHLGKQAGGEKIVHLHGSLNMIGLDNGVIIRSEEERVRFRGAYAQGKKMLFPISQKDLYVDPWFTYLLNLVTDMDYSNSWIVIGYAFNDSYILDLFKEAIKRNKNLRKLNENLQETKLVIVNPEAGRICAEKFPGETSVIPINGKFGEENTVFRIQLLTITDAYVISWHDPPSCEEGERVLVIGKEAFYMGGEIDKLAKDDKLRIFRGQGNYPDFLKLLDLIDTKRHDIDEIKRRRREEYGK